MKRLGRTGRERAPTAPAVDPSGVDGEAVRAPGDEPDQPPDQPPDPAGDSEPPYRSLEDTLTGLLERIRSDLGVDTAAVLLLDEERGVLVARAARGLEQEVREGVEIPLARGFAGRVAAQAQPIVIGDLKHGDVVNPILLQKGIRSIVGVPLRVEGRVIGVMHVGTLVRREFQEQDIARLQLAADRAALMIDEARVTEQRAVTEVMQRTLLPGAFPQVPGLCFSAKYLPAGSGIKVGGDWYDVFGLPNGRMALVIGDVVGRGVLAATVMAEARTATRAYLVEGHGLREAMTLLNELFVSLGRSRAATVAILELDLELGQIEGVSAGHLPAVVVDEDGHARLWHLPQGPPLGISSGQRYASHRRPFGPGSSLLLFTDGLVELRGEVIDEGLERLRRGAEHAASGGHGRLADRVYWALAEHAALGDDLALLAIESMPLGAVVELTLEADPHVLLGLRRTLGRWLTAMEVGGDELFDIALATSEAAANAIEHAYGARRATFEVRCERLADEVRVTVHDAGRWRAPRSNGRGRGLEIMRGLMDHVEVDRDQHGTTVTLAKSLVDGLS